jgi:hypothetical protein
MSTSLKQDAGQQLALSRVDYDEESIFIETKISQPNEILVRAWISR